MRLLVTGAAGRIGRRLRGRLVRPGRTLRLFDIVAQEPGATDESIELISGSILDPETLRAACDGVDAILHLAGLAREAPWEELLRINVDGTRRLLDAAYEAGVRRVILASSIHAVGYWSRSEAGPDGLPDDLPARPDTWYGWSKAAVEALGRLYADRFGMDVICLRIGACFPEPPGEINLPVWLSLDDCARLIEACLTAPSPGFRLVWGMSRNTRRWCSYAGGAAIGYHPVDDSEQYAARQHPPEWYARSEAGAGDPAMDLLGGAFPSYPLGHDPFREAFDVL